MPKEKFELSQTLRFLVSRLQSITGGGEVEIELELSQEVVVPGSVIGATAKLRSPEKARALEYVVIGMRGQVQKDQKWQDYTESAEIAQQTQIGADQELVIPVEIYIPDAAVLTADGGEWSLEARAVIDKTVDPRASAAFSVVEES